MSRILVVEDEARIASFVEKGLKSAGYAVACRRAVSVASTSSPIPPSWEVTPTKYWSTSSWLSPIASNTWAPR